MSWRDPGFLAAWCWHVRCPDLPNIWSPDCSVFARKCWTAGVRLKRELCQSAKLNRGKNPLIGCWTTPQPNFTQNSIQCRFLVPGPSIPPPPLLLWLPKFPDMNIIFNLKGRCSRGPFNELRSVACRLFTTALLSVASNPQSSPNWYGDLKATLTRSCAEPGVRSQPYRSVHQWISCLACSLRVATE